MSKPKTFQTVFGEAFNRAIESAVAPTERREHAMEVHAVALGEREQAERIERQLRLVKDTTRRHTDLLSLLAKT